MSSVGIAQQTFTTEASASKSIDAPAKFEQSLLESESVSQSIRSNYATIDSKQSAKNEPRPDSTKIEATSGENSATPSDVNDTNGARDQKQPSKPNSDLSTESTKSIEADTLKDKLPEVKFSNDKEEQQASAPNNTTSDANPSSAENELTNAVEQVVETIIEELNPFADDGSTVTTSKEIVIAETPIEDPKSAGSTDNRAVTTTIEATTPATFTEYQKPSTSTSAEPSKALLSAEGYAAVASNESTMQITPSESLETAQTTNEILPVTSTEVNTSIQKTSDEYPKPIASVDEVSSVEVSTFSATTASPNEVSAETLAVTSTEISIPTSSTEQPMLTTLTNEPAASTNSTEFNMHSASAEELSVTEKSSEDTITPMLSLLESKPTRVEGTARRPLLPLRSARRDRNKEQRERESRRLERDNTILKQRIERIITSPGPYNRAVLVQNYKMAAQTRNFDPLETFHRLEDSRIGKQNEKLQLRLDHIKTKPGPYNRDLLLEEFDRILGL